MKIVKQAKRFGLLFGVCLALLPGAAAQTKKSQTRKEIFGKMADGKQVALYTLTNKNGVEAKISTYGGAVVSLQVPDKHGALADVVLGFDKLENYLNSPPYIGTLIGRYANRIAKGRFTLNGVEYKLAANNGPNHLHGGLAGFDKVLWTAQPVKISKGAALALTYLSRDGEEGYPGNLSVKVIYTLTDEDALKIDYFAASDKDTVINLTNHSYFNLAGPDSGDILGHLLQIDADFFTPTDATAIPLGELRSVTGTPFDFNQLTAIGARIAADDEQIKLGKGYDHNFVVKGPAGTLRHAAKVVEPKSGRVMDVLTTEPGVQLYSGNFLDGSKIGKGGKPIEFRTGFCLETQHFPDSPNQPQFPTTTLKKGAKFTSTTIYKFSRE